ncbi:MAG TPA: hypothetical protein PLN52_00320 [Opitutaceae bacterium]|nr:hypothetical protein [Opitutaceae bacterium]
MDSVHRERFCLLAYIVNAAIMGGVLVFATNAVAKESADGTASVVRQARIHATQANEAYVRSLRLTRAWLEARDPRSGLIPSQLKGYPKAERTDVWEPHNAGADNYSFMTLTAWFLDRPLFDGPMTDILRSERKLTSRLKTLPDTYSFTKQGFQYDTADNARILFTSSEYMKDGLLPLAEAFGRSPWSERMLEMLEDIPLITRVSKGSEMERYRAVDAEINGNLLQILSRCYWMTGEARYLAWATEIGDHYLLGEQGLRNTSYLRLRDHGCEIIGGLSELYVTLHFADPAKKRLYQPAFHALLDDILKIGRNDHGLFFDSINLRDRSVVERRLADNWGYIFNAYLSVHLIDTKPAYLAAIHQALDSLNKNYRNHDWESGSHDGYADAIESALNLINRIPSPGAEEWIDSEIKVMWAMQRENGVVEGWWGDGNFSRTSIMYALWKTRGVHVHPWRDDVLVGAVAQGKGLRITAESRSAWSGRLTFDEPRHRTLLKLPIDYPRINQFPEWFTVESDQEYTVAIGDRMPTSYTGRQLVEGLPVSLSPGESLQIAIEPREVR